MWGCWDIDNVAPPIGRGLSVIFYNNQFADIGKLVGCYEGSTTV
ncbi:hypothetical protein SAMN05192574_102991 [Mucilaginibacter gossypiicola]|uniref:Uncharacterized protein n=1 Tax=Mucilaginibacter gossypiicola TaxID=551995 RepID=A0A1H8F8W6_9SPHI|nr:hypothetical protein SAMN05192574_102991 [Mucilaginibacter gossypiicola]